jgi:hypothetical protein
MEAPGICENEMWRRLVYVGIFYGNIVGNWIMFPAGFENLNNLPKSIIFQESKSFQNPPIYFNFSAEFMKFKFIKQQLKSGVIQYTE